MKITTFPKVNENPFKKYDYNDFSIETLIEQKWKKKFFKKDETGAYIYTTNTGFHLIPLGIPNTGRNKKRSIKIYGMTPLRECIYFSPSEQTTRLSSFWGTSSYGMEVVKVPDDIMTQMVRYALSQDYIEEQEYSKDPSTKFNLINGGSYFNFFIVGKHHAEENAEIFYDPQYKSFSLAVWRDNQNCPSEIYNFFDCGENHIFYFEREKNGSYTYCNGGVCFLGKESLSQNVNYGPIMTDKGFEMWNLPPSTFERIETTKNYFKERKLGDLTINKNIKIPDKKIIEGMQKTGKNYVI